MRVTFLTQSRELLFHLRQTQARKAQASIEIASGLRVTKPSDSPSDAAGVVRATSELNRLAQFSDNLGATQSELRIVDGVLSEASLVITRALSLATQAANTLNGPESLGLIRQDLEGILRHLVLIGNTSYADRFLFSGTLNQDPPFAFDGNSPDGVVYTGNSASRAITFPDGRPAQVSLPGNAIFARPDQFTGVGRTAGTVGSVIPSPPVGIGVAFSGDINAVISADLDGFFVAAGPPSAAAGGETITVNFESNDGAISESITTVPLAGGESAAQIAGLLNAAISAHAGLAGGFTFSDEGGNLKLVQSDTLGVGFTFTSSASGGLTTGLEPGGTTGGQSAEEIAAALNAQVALNEQLSSARIAFVAVGGEVQVDGDVDFEFTAVDFDRNTPPGTGFQSGLAGTHLVGGARSANVFAVLRQLIEDLDNGATENIGAGIQGLRRAVNQIGAAQGFYGNTLSQIDATLDNLNRFTIVNQQRLSAHQDADLLQSIADLTASTSAEQFALQVASRQQPTLLDLLA